MQCPHVLLLPTHSLLSRSPPLHSPDSRYAGMYITVRLQICGYDIRRRNCARGPVSVTRRGAAHCAPGHVPQRYCSCFYLLFITHSVCNIIFCSVFFFPLAFNILTPLSPPPLSLPLLSVVCDISIANLTLSNPPSLPFLPNV